jgi:ankyrin repeat protein
MFKNAIMFAEKGDFNAFFELIEANPSLLHCRDEFNSNLLIEVASYADCPTIKKLVELGCEINVLDDEGVTPMHLLIEKKGADNLNKIKLLIDLGFDLEISAFNGWKPIHKAVFHNKDDIVGLLINSGADINSKTEQSNEKTALMIAAQNNSLSMLKYLIGHGADVHIKDKYSRTAIDYCGIIFGLAARRYLKSQINIK